MRTLETEGTATDINIVKVQPGQQVPASSA